MLSDFRLTRRAIIGWTAGAVLVAACAHDRAVGPPTEPHITQVSAEANPRNVLSMVVTFRADGADSARIRYQNDHGERGETPFARVREGDARLIVLGMRASSVYSLAVEAHGPGGLSHTAPVQATTGELPVQIRTLRLAGTDGSSSGYTLVVPIYPPNARDTYVVAFDGAGEIAWYRSFSGEGWAVEAKQHGNGNFTVYLGRSYGWQAEHGRFVEVTPAGDTLRSFAAGAGFFTDPHELLLSMRDSSVAAVHLMGYELRHFDLRDMGGESAAVLAVHTIERRNASGTREFLWNATDRYSTADWPAPNTMTGDLVHPSSLALDRDGDYVLSLQAMDEVVKIDAQTGATIWRFGGRHNQFAIHGDVLNGFEGQHSVHVLSDGHLLLFDNRLRSRPRHSRAVEYDLDVNGRVARLVWAYTPTPPIVSPIMGSVQRLTNGNTVVGFGAAGQVHEVNPSGRAVRRATLSSDAGVTTTPFYRAIRIASLYRFAPP